MLGVAAASFRLLQLRLEKLDTVSVRNGFLVLGRNLVLDLRKLFLGGLCASTSVVGFSADSGDSLSNERDNDDESKLLVERTIQEHCSSSESGRPFQ